MAEPLPQPPLAQPELPKSPQLIIGETPIYLSTPITIDGQEVHSFTVLGKDQRGPSGIGSATIVTQEPSRKKGERGQLVDKVNLNFDRMDAKEWDEISSIQWTDEAGVAHTIEKDQLSLTPPEKLDIPVVPQVPDLSPEALAKGEKTQEAPLARAVLETLTEDPNTITIVGLKAYQARANDLAERSMQHMVTPKMLEREGATRSLAEKTKDSMQGIKDIGTMIWKQSLGGLYFQEKARQYYMDMLEAAETPFAEQSIRVAEARAQVNYDKMLADKNFLAKAGTRAIEWFKDKIGARTTVQQFALEELRGMKEAGELSGTDIFEREAKAVRLRFGQDMEHADQFVRKAFGEKLEILDPENEEHKPLVEGVHSLMKRYATGEITDKAAFDAESKAFFKTTLKDAKPEIFAEAELYSSSLFDAAETLRAKASHEGGLANIDADLAQMKIRLGLGQMGEATSLEPDKVSKGIEKALNIVKWIESKNIPLRPALFNEVTIGSGVAILLSAANVFKTMPARIIGGLGAGAIAGGAFAGYREYHKLQREYLTHTREREVGTTFGEHLQKRKWFEKYVVKQRSADDMMTTLQSNLYTPEGVLKDTLSVDDLRSSFATLADIQARKTLSETSLNRTEFDTDTKRIGLIQFTGRENIESQRTALDIVASRALSDLSSLSDLGKIPEEVLGGNTFPDFMVKLTTHQTQILKEGINTLSSLDDPYKNVLGLVSSYAPEADIIKRRWPFAGATEEMKALGIDAIFAEFKKEAKVEAIKYGIKQGIIGAGVGAVMHEAFVLLGGGASHITETVKEAIKNNTEVATFNPDASNIETITLHPSANVWNDYQIPKELKIISHSIGGPDERITTFDATFQQTLGKDISLGNGLSADDLMDKLHSIKGIDITEGHTTTDVIAPPHPVDIPDLTAKNGEQLKVLLPQGYSLQPDGNGFDIMFGKDTVPVLEDVRFNDDGTIANQLNLHLPGNWHIDPGTTHTVEIKTEIPLSSGIETPLKEPITIQAKDMGEGGVSDYFLGKTGNVTEGNAMKNLFRMYEVQHQNDNISFTGGDVHKDYFSDIDSNHFRDATFGGEPVREINLNRLPNDIQFELPPELFGKDAIEKFSTLNHDALIRYNEVLVTAKGPVDALHILETGNETDQLNAVALRLGYFGRDSDLKFSDEQMKLLYDYMGYHPGEVAADDITEKTTNQVVHEMAIRITHATDVPGTIGATNNTIDVPYLTPSDMEAVKEQVAQAQMSPDDKLEALRLDRLAAVPHETFWEKTWFPIFIPTRRGLESARSASPLPPETIDLSASMLSPFGVDTNLITREQLAQRVSPRLSENAEAILNPQQEIAWYLEHLSAEEQALNAELLTLEPNPMSATTKAAVIIPVSNNTTQLSQTLTNYVAQTLDPKAYELVVYNALLGENPTDELKATIDQFKADHPDHQVAYLTHTYTEEPTNGKLKRDISNAVLARAAAIPDVAIISDPGMAATLPDTYLASMMDGLIEKDMVAGRYEYPKIVYEQHPLLFAQSRAYELMDALTRHTHGGNVPNAVSGNTAVRASTLAAIGGYNGTSAFAEDRELAWMIQTARKNNDTVTVVPEVITLDPAPIIEKYADSYTKDMLEADVTKMYNGLYPTLRAKDPEAFDRNFNFTLDSLGLAHEIVDGKVTILDDSKLASAITGIPDIESFGRVTAEQFAEADRTAREVLEHMAGDQIMEAEPMKKTETVASNISSPDLSAEALAKEEVPQAPQPVESLPAGINDRIDYVLEKNQAEKSASVSLTPGELMHYLQTDLDIPGTRVTGGNVQYADGKLHLQNLTAKSYGGEYQFSADLMSDPTKGLVVDPATLQMKLPMIMKIFAGKARNMALNLSDTMLTHINERSNPMWNASRIELVGEKLEIKFNKKI